MAKKLTSKNSMEVGGERYNLQYRRCSRKACKCHDGNDKRHGPYWYKAVMQPNGIQRNVYIGRQAPCGEEDVAKAS